MAEVLLTGVPDDLDEIVYKFSSLKSFEFDKFTSVWNELKFYNIYCGRPTELEMRFFTQHMLMFCKNIAVNKETDEWERVSGLYLLYCLYYSQPLLKHVEIRINHDDLKELEQFVISIQARCFSPVYAFMKLISDNAFHFVYNDVPNTVERSGKVDMNLLGKLGDEGVIKEQRQAVVELLKKAKVDEKEWRSLETDYNNTLACISQMNIGPCKVKFSQMDFFKEMLFPEKLPQPDAVEACEDLKPVGIPKRKKQRLLKMMVEGLLTKDEEIDEGAHPDGQSLPLLDCPMDT